MEFRYREAGHLALEEQRETMNVTISKFLLEN
jgi:hypothetical protein